MKSIDKLIELVESRKLLQKQLRALYEMQGEVEDNKGKPQSRCGAIEFRCEYSGNATWYSQYDNGTLNKKLVNTAVEYIEETLGNIDTLLSQIDELIEGRMSTDEPETTD